MTRDEQLFLALAGWLDADTSYVADIGEIMGHTAGRQIVDMGSSALRLMLKHDKPDEWLSLAAKITGGNPVPEEDRGRVAKMKEHWRRWITENLL